VVDVVGVATRAARDGAPGGEMVVAGHVHERVDETVAGVKKDTLWGISEQSGTLKQFWMQGERHVSARIRGCWVGDDAVARAVDLFDPPDAAIAICKRWQGVVGKPDKRVHRAYDERVLCAHCGAYLNGALVPRAKIFTRRGAPADNNAHGV